MKMFGRDTVDILNALDFYDDLKEMPEAKVLVLKASIRRDEEKILKLKKGIAEMEKQLAELISE